MAIGYLYILFNPSLRSGLFKIGKTTRDPRMRARELSQTSGVPEPYEVLFTQRVEACEIAERLVHSLLARYRRFRNREFFCMPLEQAIEAVQRACELTDNLMDDGLFDGQFYSTTVPYERDTVFDGMSFADGGRDDSPGSRFQGNGRFSALLSKTNDAGQVILLELRNRIWLTGPDITERIAGDGHVAYARRPDRIFTELIIKPELIQALFLQLDLEVNKSVAVWLNRAVTGEKQDFLHRLRSLEDVDKIAPIIQMSYLKARWSNLVR